MQEGSTEDELATFFAGISPDDAEWKQFIEFCQKSTTFQPLAEILQRNRQQSEENATENSMTVMVLSVSKPFKYKIYKYFKKEPKEVLHAIVATETRFFHVKVLNSDLQSNFAENRIITISNYVQDKGILEVNEDSHVDDADSNQMIVVPDIIKEIALEPLRIYIIEMLISGTIINGSYTLHRKSLEEQTTIYEVQDDTGSIIEVVGEGRCHDFPCEEGDTLKFFFFQVQTIKTDTIKLKSNRHSFIQACVGQEKKERAAPMAQKDREPVPCATCEEFKPSPGQLKKEKQ